MLKRRVTEDDLIKRLCIKAHDECRAFGTSHDVWLAHESNYQTRLTTVCVVKGQQPLMKEVLASYHDDITNANMLRALRDYRQDESTIHRWKAEVKEPVSYLFTLTTIVNDGYLQLHCNSNNDSSISGSTKQFTGQITDQSISVNVNFQRWLAITKRLPLELTSILCHYAYFNITTLAAINNERAHIHSQTVNCQASAIIQSFS